MNNTEFDFMFINVLIDIIKVYDENLKESFITFLQGEIENNSKTNDDNKQKNYSRLWNWTIDFLKNNKYIEFIPKKCDEKTFKQKIKIVVDKLDIKDTNFEMLFLGFSEYISDWALMSNNFFEKKNLELVFFDMENSDYYAVSLLKESDYKKLSIAVRLFDKRIDLLENI